jgi:hypothetical protein
VLRASTQSTQAKIGHHQMPDASARVDADARAGADVDARAGAAVAYVSL